MTRRDAIKAVAVGGAAGALAALDKTHALAFMRGPKPVQCWGPPMPPEHGPRHIPGPGLGAAVEHLPNGDVEITFPSDLASLPTQRPPHRIKEGLEVN